MKTNSYNKVISALKEQSADGTPVINSVGTYTKQFMEVEDAYWPEAHRNPEKMMKLASAAHRLCGLDNITVPFDLVVEAEILGAPINYFEGKVKWPSPKDFILKDISDLMIPNDPASQGRVPLIVEAIQLLKNKYEGTAPIIAYINCPFTSISSYLVDTSTFLMWIKLDPKKVKEFYKITLECFAAIANAYKEAGADIITFREEGCSTNNVSPSHFQEFIQPNLKKLIEKVKPPRILHICGSTEAIIPMMMKCEAEAISIDQSTPIKQAREITNTVKSRYPIVGNIDPYNIISKGTSAKINESVRNVINDGVTLVAPGCDFWIDTPIENMQAFVDAAHTYG